MTGPQETPSWRTWVEPWYLSYALLGASAAGLAPILLPLAVGGHGDLAQVGLVMALFNLGGLVAPFWGDIADRRHNYRLILIGGLAATAVGFALFSFAHSLTARLFLALMQGGGAAAAATVGNMLIVEAHPRTEWDKRIGWLQTFYGLGQVAGLLLAGIFSGLDMRISLGAASFFSLCAILPAGAIRPFSLTKISPRPVLLHPARHAELSAGSPQRFHHHPGRSSLRSLFKPMLSPFGAFLFAWFLSFAGTTGFFSLYPVMMHDAYGVGPSIASPAFAVAAGIGLLLYAPAGKWSDRFGPLRVLQAGLGVRVLAFAGLAGIGYLAGASRVVPALTAFLLIVLAWSLLSVTSTALSARLANMGEGEALGLYNATTAVAGVLGSALGGWLASRWGPDAVPVMGAVGVTLGLIVVSLPNHKQHAVQTSSIVQRS